MNAHTSVGPLDRAARVYIAGHRGLVGSALLRTFAGAGFTNLLVRSRAELDLTDRVRRQHGLPWISAMPTNLYGPGDNFSPSGSHLLPALIRRYDEAKASGAPNVTNWGTGTPRRELLHVDDLASACLYLLEHFDGPTHVNVGTGIDHTIGEIAEMVASAVGYSGETRWDPSKPDGTPRKLLDVSVLREAGWRPSIALRDGIEATVAWYREHAGTVRQ